MAVDRLAEIAQHEEAAAAADALRAPWEQKLLSVAREQEANRCDLIAAGIEARVARGVESELHALAVLVDSGLDARHARALLAQTEGR